MKIRYRLGKEGLFGKPVLVVQIFKHFPDGPSDAYGSPISLAHSAWVDAEIADLTEEQKE